MADVEETSNGRVTMAILRNDIMHMADDFVGMRDEVRGWRADHETRLRAVETCTTVLKTNQTQLMDDAKKGDRNNNIFSMISSTVTAAISGVAAVVIAGMGK